MRNAIKRMGVVSSRIPGLAGLVAYTCLLCMAAALLPASALDPSARFFLAGIGLIAAWRYSWGLTNFLRSIVYRRQLFPRWRRTADYYGSALMPSKIYILMTVFRIEPEISARAIRAAIEEAIRCDIPVTIVASIVEVQDEYLFKSIFSSYNVPDHIDLRIIRVKGTGKRSGLAQGFKVISRDMPPYDAVVAVMDGDTILLPDSLRRCVPFFKLRPNLGALTTDEIGEVHGSKAMQEWHEMRFAQRHILMSSLSLSKRVMTLTGRMSMYRADIVTHPEFIEHMDNDYLDHWRLGKFKFMTGDDKSSLYWVMKKGYEQIYVPDVQVLTLEDPPSGNFFKASTQLMYRWFGNMLRTNARILRLGPGRMPLFVWWAFVDQRLSMWTTLSGPVFALMLAVKYGPVFIAYYLVWVAFIRWVMTVMLLNARPETSWRYPFLLYYNQVYGALLKTWILFRLDRQSWTRQKTVLQRNLSRGQYLWNVWSSHAVHAAAVIILVCVIGMASEVLAMPEGTLRAITGYGGMPH